MAASSLALSGTSPAPLLWILSLLYIVVPLRAGRVLPGIASAMRFCTLAKNWSMLEVFLLSVLVTYIKLAGVAKLGIGPGPLSFAADQSDRRLRTQSRAPCRGSQPSPYRLRPLHAAVVADMGARARDMRREALLDRLGLTLQPPPAGCPRAPLLLAGRVRLVVRGGLEHTARLRPSNEVSNGLTGPFSAKTTAGYVSKPLASVGRISKTSTAGWSCATP